MAAASSPSSTDGASATNDDGDDAAPVVSEMQRRLRGADHRMGGFSRGLLRGVTVRSYSAGSPPRLTVSFVVTPALCNGFDTLHGGASATAVDVFTSVLLHAFHPVPSVTSDLHVSTVAPAPLGSTVACVCRVERAGGGLQYASCDLFREDPGGDGGGGTRRVLVAKGLHTKYVLKDRSKGFGGGGATATATASRRSKL